MLRFLSYRPYPCLCSGRALDLHCLPAALAVSGRSKLLHSNGSVMYEVISYCSGALCSSTSLTYADMLAFNFSHEQVFMGPLLKLCSTPHKVMSDYGHMAVRTHRDSLSSFREVSFNPGLRIVPKSFTLFVATRRKSEETLPELQVQLPHISLRLPV